MARCARINKRTVYYAKYAGEVELTDSAGNYTGEHKATYTDPVEAQMNVSPSRGTYEVGGWNFSVPYSKTLETEDMETDFDKDTVFWIGIDPTTHSHNYVVTGVARGLPRSGTTKIAVKEVDAVESSN